MAAFLVACGDGDGDGGDGGGKGGSPNDGGEAGAPGGSSGMSGASGSPQGGASGSPQGGLGGDEGGAPQGGSAGLAGEAGAGGDEETGGGAGISGSGGSPTGGMAGNAGTVTGGAGTGGGGAGGAGMGGAGTGGGGAGGAGMGGAGAGGAGAGSGGSGGVTTCNGAPEPGCSCLKVTRDGNDAQAAASGGVTAFRTVQAAIDYAATAPGVPSKVCVAGFDTCSSATAYPAARMRNGISVYGRYESTGWTRCDSYTTILTSSSTQNVHFGSDIAQETVLDGFRIEPASVAPPSTVTLDAARNAVLSDVGVDAGSARGIDVLGAADVHIDASSVSFRAGAVGIQVTGSKAVIEDCSVEGPNLATGAEPATAVVLDGAVGSLIVQSSLDSTGGSDVAAVRIVGAATGVEIRESSLEARNGGSSTTAIALASCGGASPLIADNPTITASSTQRNPVIGIASSGDCHPRIEYNPAILVSAPVGAPSVTGVECGSLSGCVIVGNTIRNEQPSFLPGDIGAVTGISCADACVRVADNDVAARSPGCMRSCASTTVGLRVASTTLVERNEIASSSVTNATGVSASGTPRLQNNFIRATLASSGPGGPAPTGIAYGLNVFGAADTHSNTIVVDQAGSGPGIMAAAALSGGGATFRNNVLYGGVRELGFFADPAIFQNNLAGIYFDEGGMIPTIGAAAINALTDMTVSGTIDGNPAFVSFPNDLHILSTSACRDAGTPEGAPADDVDGEARVPPPDIGADESSQANETSAVESGKSLRIISLSLGISR